MNIIEIIITSFFILAFLTVIFLVIKRAIKNMGSKEDKQHFSVRQTRLLFWTGTVCCLFFCALLVLITLYPNDTSTWEIYFSFLGFVVASLSLMIWGTRWEININSSQIKYTPFLGKTKVFTISQITKVWQDTATSWGPSQKPLAIKIYDGDKRLFTVHNHTRKFNMLIYMYTGLYCNQLGLPLIWDSFVNPFAGKAL